MHIYKVVEKRSGKCYVGQTRTSLSRRFWGYRSPLLASLIKELGREGFIMELLEDVPDEQADQAERKWCKQLNTYAPNGYNIREAGFYGAMSASTKVKLSEVKKGKSVSDKSLANLQLGNAARWTDAGKIKSSGQGNPRALLTEEQVRQIRRLYQTGITQQQLAGKFGIKQVTVSAIVRHKTWKQLQD